MNFAKLFFFFFFFRLFVFALGQVRNACSTNYKKEKEKKKNSQLAYRFNITERVETYIWRDTHTKKKKEKRGVRFGSSLYACLACCFSVFLSRINCICRQHGKTRCSIAKKKRQKKKRREKKQSSVESLKKCVSLLFFFSIIIRGALLSLSPFSSSLAVNVWGTIVFLFPFYSLWQCEISSFTV